jgi:hypothetical protein
MSSSRAQIASTERTTSAGDGPPRAAIDGASPSATGDAAPVVSMIGPRAAWELPADSTVAPTRRSTTALRAQSAAADCI